MKMETKDRYFKETVEQLKEWGFMVYAHANIFENGFRYGWVTDGTHILYFQIDDLYGLQWSTECIPTKETGVGMRIHINLSKEAIIEAFQIQYGQPYLNFEHFVRRQWVRGSTLMQL